MRILMAGGAGYLGSVLVPKLLDRGYEVDVVDLFWFVNHLPPEAGIIRKDIFDINPEDLQPYQQVVFLAGLSNDPMAEFSPSQNFIFNAAAPAYLAYVAKKANVKRYVYACSCSVYGYTDNELFDESRPVSSSYPYGISKLQGEQAVMNLMDEGFSVIALRKGTISGYSPRMRLDLIVNTMFRTALQGGTITINNPAIWRPILAMEDAITGYVRAIEAHESISGIFNIASGNYTVGEVGDLVKAEIEQQLGAKIKLVIRHLQDFRNYKVSFEKAKNVLSFHPQDDIRAIISQLVRERHKFSDWENPMYYNIQMFRELENGTRSYELGAAVGAAR